MRSGKLLESWKSRPAPRPWAEVSRDVDGQGRQESITGRWVIPAGECSEGSGSLVAIVGSFLVGLSAGVFLLAVIIRGMGFCR